MVGLLYIVARLLALIYRIRVGVRACVRAARRAQATCIPRFPFFGNPASLPARVDRPRVLSALGHSHNFPSLLNVYRFKRETNVNRFLFVATARLEAKIANANHTELFIGRKLRACVSCTFYIETSRTR